MTKISDLPIATALTGDELVPVLQGSTLTNRKIGIGAAQILPVYGALPTDQAAGSVGYVVDAVGGPGPNYYDGSDWQNFRKKKPGQTSNRTKIMGDGVWLVGIGPSDGPAHNIGYDKGLYFYSLDGFEWEPATVGTAGMEGGIAFSAYANGRFLFMGMNEYTNLRSARIVATHKPNTDDVWDSEPPLGYNILNVGSEPRDAHSYDELFSFFRVPIEGVGTINIQNPLPRAVTPDERWPYIGVNLDYGQQVIQPTPSVLGVGTLGPVEVRINTEILAIRAGVAEVITGDFAPFVPGNITAYTVPNGVEGSYQTDFIQVRKMGTSDWGPVTGLGAQVLLNGRSTAFNAENKASAVGIALTALIWGPIKATAVKFEPGGG